MRPTNQTTTTLTGTVVAETSKALLFEIAGMDEEDHKSQWFPLSQVNSIHRDPNTVGQDKINVNDWILKQKGLI